MQGTKEIILLGWEFKTHWPSLSCDPTQIVCTGKQFSRTFVVDAEGYVVY